MAVIDVNTEVAKRMQPRLGSRLRERQIHAQRAALAQFATLPPGIAGAPPSAVRASPCMKRFNPPTMAAFVAFTCKPRTVMDRMAGKTRGWLA